MATTLYVLVTEDGLDQICETEQTAMQERKDLKAMCNNVRMFVITHDSIANQTWLAAYDIESVLANGKPFGRKGMKRLEDDYNVTVKLK